MRFHLNGFKTGDPAIPEPAGRREQPDRLPEEVNILIVGCGPAGLTLAAQLSAFPDIKTRIVGQKSGPLTLGQADGVACRTMETFEAFGLAGEGVLRTARVREDLLDRPKRRRRIRPAGRRSGARAHGGRAA
jgi:2-polyprenyl-6-methoxyphenol hydroxylase-like FAD-dependent oxidoreductase